MDEITSSCRSCGASVYKEHIESGIARYEKGKLLCAHCVAEYDRAHGGPADKDDDALAPISFDDDETYEPKPDLSSSRIHGATAATLGQTGLWNESRFRRALVGMDQGATRCRTFHSKLSAAAIDFMNNQINDWLDGNEQILIKFATSTIGPFEGKHTEQNLIITLFY